MRVDAVSQTTTKKKKAACLAKKRGGGASSKFTAAHHFLLYFTVSNYLVYKLFISHLCVAAENNFGCLGRTTSRKKALDPVSMETVCICVRGCVCVWGGVYVNVYKSDDWDCLHSTEEHSALVGILMVNLCNKWQLKPNEPILLI